MLPSIKKLGEILYAPSQYVIPVFQRNYRWEAPQWEKLWNSLLEFDRGERKGNHFMGFLVFVPGVPQPGQHTQFHLVDGQQRLTTSSILLTAIRNVARERGFEDLSDEIHQDYLVHPRKRGDQFYRLLPKERDHDSYVALVSGQGEPRGRMADGLAYFEEKLLSPAFASNEQLRKLCDTVRTRLEFMCATLESENAYNIFKSLNSTGVPLGPSDLIRNFVFMHVVPDEQDEFDSMLWRPLENKFSPEGTLDENWFSDFFRAFLMSEGHYISPADTFASFEERYEATGFSPSALAQELTRHADNFLIISGKKNDDSDTVTKALKGLNALESSTTYPLLLHLFTARESEGLTSSQLVECIEMLRGFILRRFVCGESSRGYGQMFVRAIDPNAVNVVDSLKAYLLDRGWPDDFTFIEAFVEFPLYQRAYAQVILQTLERSRGHKEPADLSSAQVEHIMPQTLSDAWIEALGSAAESVHSDWLHRPGNLTLSAYNQELWNHSFPVKSARYRQSNIVITRELGEYGNWGEDEIKTRGRSLAEEAAQIWTGPREAVARPDVGADDDAPGRRELRVRFWQGLSDYLAAERPTLPSFESRPNWTVRLPSGVRHIGLELRFGLRHGSVGIDLWFWRAACIPAWERIRACPDEYDAALGVPWQFERVEGQTRARMWINESGDLRHESTWPALYSWLGEKLSLVYENVVPRLRAEMDASGDHPQG